jgi:hypothetical protein
VQFAFRILGLAATLLLALGAVCLLLGLYLLSQSLEATSGAIATTGEVVSYLEKRDGDEVFYRPRVRFTTLRGDIVTIASPLAAKSQRFAIGARVPVTYPPDEPIKGRIATFTDNWLGPLVSGVVGLVIFVAGIFVRRAARREVAKAPA